MIRACGRIGSGSITPRVDDGSVVAGAGAVFDDVFDTGSLDRSKWNVRITGREFKVDGALTNRVTRPMVEFFGPWAFDNEKLLMLNVALGGTYPFKSNGIRSPYSGMSEHAVQAVKIDRAKVLVDWIRVDDLDSQQEVV